MTTALTGGPSRVISKLTVKEAGRTSLLSSQWRKRWTHHRNLCFDGTSGSELGGYDTDRFVDHVATVLQHHDRLAVDRFELRSRVHGEEHAHHLDRWLGFVAASKAKHVTLDLSPGPLYKHAIVASRSKYRLPTCIANASIESMLLGHVCLELPPASAGGLLLGPFKTLKKLELKFVADLGDLTPFLSNCPALECLNIHRSFLGHHLVVPPARCLRYLRVARCPGLKSMQLNATSLTAFEYLGFPSVPIKTDDALKLSQASVTLYWLLDTVGYFWDQLSCWLLAPVDRLTLSFSMDTETTRFIKNPTKFINLRRMTLFCNIHGNPKSALVVLRLTQILESAPHLEYFVLHLDSFDPRPLILRTADDCIVPQVHHHLKTVHMTGVFGLLGQLEMAKYILLSAKALEFLTLNLPSNINPRIRRESDHAYFTSLEKFAKNNLDPQGAYCNNPSVNLQC
ncbi:hypothetical protein C2845_PM01G27660 [Panicum miliaceum]|uniref:At1g61320/AtMIF1 LRR domain-containing protein n=1 Tax=Panicum miliaceum TaxID=4540 RepID=A0A3L6TN48_PANMI|nr:hypothetical protein C2845_PM01G27660 [Panicum miliaceum]